MMKFILSLSVLGFFLTALSPAVLAQQTTVRTGPNGRSATTNRTYNGYGNQTTVRTGPNGRSATTNRSW
jgi:hypothetical protein